MVAMALKQPPRPPEPLPSPPLPSVSSPELATILSDATEQLSRDGSGLDSVSELLAQAAENARQTEALHSALTEDLAALAGAHGAAHEAGAARDALLQEIQQLRAAAAEAERRRAHEAALAHEELMATRARLEESEEMRARETALAKQSLGGRNLLEKAMSDAHAEVQRLQTAFQVEQARAASAEGSKQALLENVERERGAVKMALAAELAQERALASGVKLKNKKLQDDVQRLEADLARERQRAEAMERGAAAAAAEATGAVQRAARAEQRAASDGREALERESDARKQAEAKAGSLDRQLKEALRACETAKAECARVAERNEALEEELRALRGGSRYGVEDLVGQIDEMEAMLDPAKAREAEKRLKERARRANAKEVEARLS